MAQVLELSWAHSTATAAAVSPRQAEVSQAEQRYWGGGGGTSEERVLLPASSPLA